MAETVIFAEQTLGEFLPNVEFGELYTYSMNFGDDIDAFTIVLGKTYMVLWDGTWYTVVAEDASSIIEGSLFLGNGSMFGLSGNNEPFAIGWAEPGVTFFSLTDTVNTHTVAIYQIVEEKGIIVKDRNGTDVEHIGAAAIRVRTTDGGTKKFLDSDTMQPLEVTENGTYAVEGNSCGYSPVTVKVPDPVLQEKTITENGEYTADDGFDGLSKVFVEVAGSGGGLLETPIVAEGTFTPNASAYTFEHNLGVVPDCIVISTSLSSTATTQVAVFAIGFRTGVVPGVDLQSIMLALSNGGNTKMGLALGIETSGNSYLGFKNADATSVKFGGSWSKLQTGTEYTWKAVRFTP